MAISPDGGRAVLTDSENRLALYQISGGASFNCKEVFYQTVEPDQTFEQESFITHVWHVYKVDANGGKKLYKTLVVNSSNTSTTIQ